MKMSPPSPRTSDRAHDGGTIAQSLGSCGCRGQRGSRHGAALAGVRTDAIRIRTPLGSVLHGTTEDALTSIRE